MSAPPVLLALLLCSAGPEAPGPAATRPEPPAIDPAVAAILSRWEAATADRVPVSEAEKAAMRLANPDRSEELLELLVAIKGPVSAADLLERYEWRMNRMPPGHWSLSATPRDPLARAFTPALVVVLKGDATPMYVAVAKGSASTQFGEMLVRAQSPEVTSYETRRPPVRTAEYVKPAGDGPIWKLERRLKKTPATRLVNNRLPLTAPRPR